MDPATGTFTTMDTYGGNLTDPMSLHKYLFANSNPVMYCDPSGHFSLAEMDAAMAIDIMLDSSYLSGFLYIVDASITDPELEHHDIMGYFGAVGFGFIFSGLSLMLSSFVTGALVLAVINTVFASMGVAKGIQDFDNGHTVYGPLEAVTSVVGCAIGWNNFANVWCAQQTSELIHVKGRGTENVGDGGSNIDFYVTPNGDVVPAVGYRYVSENVSYLDSMSKSMTIPANESGTYFSFNRYDVANPSALQVPHDASVRVEFDTLQIIDDISVPFGNWGKAPYLEPITKDFPQFGNGGATQVITHSDIQIDLITKLPKC